MKPAVIFFLNNQIQHLKSYLHIIQKINFKQYKEFTYLHERQCFFTDVSHLQFTACIANEMSFGWKQPISVEPPVKRWKKSTNYITMSHRKKINKLNWNIKIKIKGIYRSMRKQKKIQKVESHRNFLSNWKLIWINERVSNSIQKSITKSVVKKKKKNDSKFCYVITIIGMSFLI